MTGKLFLCGALIGSALMLGATAPSKATLLSASALSGAADELRVDTPVRRGGAAGVRRGGAVGVRGGAVGVRRGGAVAVRRGGAVAVRRGGAVAVRRGAVGVGGAAAVRRAAWVRPAYRWRRGGAIAAGAAIGFVSAATAAAWAGAAPGPGLCWYYTDASRIQGFWDYCQ